MQRKFPVPPNGNPAFVTLADARMYWPVQYARLQASLREGFQARVGVPFERLLLHWWQQDGPGSRWVERRGLPRRAVEHVQGDSLVVRVNPRELLRIRDWRGLAKQQRPSSSTFIWKGDWDLRRGDLRQGSRYRFISDLVAHRDNLDGSGAFSHFNARLVAGHPWSSHQQGLLLDSETRILTFLRVYLQFMDDMACNGFDYHKGKDELGVAVSREGRLIKLNRGLHRLAMAQYLGLPTIPVKVKAVHRDWWQGVTRGVQGAEALARVAAALPSCAPETAPGALDPT